MAAAKPASRGRDLAQRLRDGVGRVARAPRPGARALPVLVGLTPRCIFTRPLENVLADAAALLAASGRVYARGDAIELEVGEHDERRLVPLSASGAVEPSAAARLANLFLCEMCHPEKEPIQFAPPRGFVDLLLNSEVARGVLPVVKTYAPRPLFDEDYNLLGPGWHAESGILVHGPSVEPVLDELPHGGLASPLDRMPPRIRALLAGFCFRSPSDLANTVGALLTALLVNLFVADGKPFLLIDANQAGLGKTLLARVLGILLDGVEPSLIHYTSDDEELAKRICATLRGGQSLVLIDNAKVRGGGAVSSAVLESNSMAPRLSLRILGQSANFSRPNDMLWVITMNDTRTSPDLVSRGLPVRLQFDGDPRHRQFAGPEPLAFATEHRAEILGELAGLVIRWNQAGRPEGPHDHRCGRWARTIGGVLQVAGLTEFLGNMEDAAASFDEDLDELSALAEAAVQAGGDGVVVQLEPDHGA